MNIQELKAKQKAGLLCVCCGKRKPVRDHRHCPTCYDKMVAANIESRWRRARQRLRKKEG